MMSYARWGYEDSDVYVYLDCSGFLLCVCGDPAETGLGFRAYKTEDMITHLKEHQVEGRTVPTSTFADLLEDAVENDEWITKTINREIDAIK